MTHLYESLWVNEVNNLSGRQHCVNKTLLLRSGFCDYNDAHIVVKAIIDLLAAATMKFIKHRMMFHLKMALLLDH